MSDTRELFALQQLYASNGFLVIGATGHFAIGTVLDNRFWLNNSAELSRYQWVISAESSKEELNRQAAKLNLPIPGFAYSFFYKVVALD